MKESFLIEGRPHAVSLGSPKQWSLRGEGLYLIEVDGVLRRVELIDSGPNHLDLVIDGRRIVLDVAQVAPEGTSWISGAGWVRRVEKVTGKLRTRAAREGGLSEKSAGIITPPFPSIIVNIMVSLGDFVVVDQPLVVISAMKMEMTLRSRREGLVKAIPFPPGAAVSPGDELVLIVEKHGGSHDE